MNNKEESIVSVFEAKRSWYELVIAAVFFSVTIAVVIFVIFINYNIHSLLTFITSMRILALIGVMSFVAGLKFSQVRNLQIDFHKNLIITRYVVGPFSYKTESKVTEFEYVSFFKVNNTCFGTNLWYVKNRHFEMYEFETKERAYQFSLDLSTKLKIDLLDATEKGNFKWIEKENSNSI